jgi:hypothetical protein
MTLRRLVVKEILHRKLNFALGLLSVVVAVACLVGAMTLLRGHDIRTDEIVAQKEAETEEMMRRMEADYRKITKGMGFNILIVPKDQNLSDLYADDYGSNYMPEEYVQRLASSRIMTIRHLLPSLQQKLRWSERERTILLIGTRGEVPLVHRDPKKPILEPVLPGTMVVGYELHRSLGLSVGDKVKLLGREFTVGKLHPERGTKDDITIWIALGEAQELLDRKGLINAILALECRCAWADLARVREEVGRILPDTQVIEHATKALARAETRKRAESAAREAVEAEKRNRARLRAETEAFAAVLVPLVVVGAAVWMGILAFGNVRERRAEIGILRALGLRSRQVLFVFLVKALLTGLAGAAPGFLVGWLIGAAWGKEIAEGAEAGALFDPVLLVTVLLTAPILSAVAAWLPATIAAQQDPAIVLREE